MSINAFNPQGNTITFTAFTTAPTAVQAVSAAGTCNAYRILNTGNVTVFLGVGNSAANAGNNAIQFSGNTAPCLPILPGTDEILIFSPGAFFTGNATANCVVYVTPGEGL